MPPRRDDETQHLVIVRSDAPKHPDIVLRDVIHMIRDALQARAQMVNDLGGAVEYEAQLARERIQKDGVDADLSAIRIGEYFKRMTEFTMLQRVYRAIESRVAGRPAVDKLSPDGEDG